MQDMLNVTDFSMAVQKTYYKESLKFIQISDLHLFADQDSSLLGVNTRQSFDAVLEHMKSNYSSLDFIVVTGDISQDYSIESYQYFAEQIKQFNCPVYCISGNHDEKALLYQVLNDEYLFCQPHIITAHWQLFFLESQVQGQVYGEINPQQLQWLDDSLANNPNKNAQVFVHHHPIKINSQWLDKIGILNGQQLSAVFERHSHLKSCAFGHVHQDFEQSINGVTYRAVPSTCVQFKARSESFMASDELPGYRVYQCASNGEIVSQIVRLEDFSMQVDHQVSGY